MCFLFFNPNRSLGFMLELNLFLASCKDFVEDLAGYVEAKFVTKCKIKLLWHKKTSKLTYRRPNDRFGLKSRITSQNT